MAKIALFHHAACGRHDTGWHHPEHQGRLRAVMGAVHAALPSLLPDVEPVEGSPADRSVLELVHSPALIDRVMGAVEQAKASDGIVALDADTVVSAASGEAALAAVGCVLDAVDAVQDGLYGGAFCGIRPPGHHATPNRSMGFCLFNNLAIGARHALETERARRVLIVDWDVHHGNGTQEVFYRDPDIFYLSLHQSPFYPGTGAASETGEGEGAGTTLNLPMPPGLEAERYVGALLEAAGEVIERFEPDLLMISSGFDAAIDDPLGGFTLREEDYRRLTEELVLRSATTARGRVVSVLEGGYNPEELGRNAVAHILALRDAVSSLNARPERR